MLNFSTPEESGSYSLEIQETSDCFAFLNPFVSALLNKDIFIDSFLSKDVFPNITIFLEQFEDKLDEKVFSLLENSPAVLSLAITSLILTTMAIIFFMAMLCYQCRKSSAEVTYEDQDRSSSRRERRPQSCVLLCVLLCVCLGGCIWVVWEARMVNRGVAEIPEVSRMVTIPDIIVIILFRSGEAFYMIGRSSSTEPLVRLSI